MLRMQTPVFVATLKVGNIVAFSTEVNTNNLKLYKINREKLASHLQTWSGFGLQNHMVGFGLQT